MDHTPYGYRIVNGVAVIEEEKAEKIRKLYERYLSGITLRRAAKEMGICHGTAGRILRNKHYLGDAYYPAIIDQATFDATEMKRKERAENLGRNRKPKKEECKTVPITFHIGVIQQKYKNPFRQAEYVYSEVNANDSE